MLDRLRPFVAAALLATGAFAQDPITEERVREVVTWLAADERRGRDTGSVELEQCADWLAERFAAAGLEPGAGGSWFHEWSMPGLRLDSDAITVSLVRKLGEQNQAILLEPGRDVRWWRPADGVGGDDEPCTVAHVDEPAVQTMLDLKSARRALVIEVPDDHPYWRKADGAHELLGGVRGAAKPVFLVRQGLLPPPPPPDKEALWSITWTTPAAERAEVPLRNVTALLPGTTKKDEYVVVSAHYDHVGVGRPAGDDPIYNGADDNATGTTAVLLVAEGMAKQPRPQRSVLFVCFAAEERGLRGSAAFCDRPPVPRAQLVCNLNLEMVGRPAPGNVGKAWLTGQGFSDFAQVIEGPLQRAGVMLVEFDKADMLFAASDNWSFVRHGIVAHSLSAGSLHEDYHRPSDEVEKLDLAHMTRIVRALVPAVRELADRDALPTWNEKGRKQVERAQR